MIEFSCSVCGRRLRAPDELSGTRVDCPNCQARIAVTNQLPAPAERNGSRLDTRSRDHKAQPGSTSERVKAVRVKDVLLALAASASLIFFLIAYSKPPGAAVAFSYAGLIVGLQILSHLLYFGMRPGTSRNIFRYLAPAAIAAIVCMAWHFDSYETRHELENGGTYIVTFSRMGVPQSEWISSGGLGHGPLTPSGKRHGRWEFIGSDGSGGLAVTPVFYWYGERVTEAEFHSKPPPPRPSVVERFWLAFILLYGLAWGALALPLRRGHGRRKCGDTGPASECKS